VAEEVQESRFTPGSEERLRQAMRTLPSEQFAGPAITAALERQMKAEAARPKFKDFETEFGHRIRYDADGRYTAELSQAEAKKYYLEMEAPADAIEQEAFQAHNATLERVPVIAANGTRYQAPAHLEPLIAQDRRQRVKAVRHWGRRRRRYPNETSEQSDARRQRAIW